ncbi:MAG: TetR family transcriptional regulator [Deltaproteobacteria bacterium]|nr:TetR family transcriptional regulator [Deltaproteobacteria bacterium]
MNRDRIDHNDGTRELLLLSAIDLFFEKGYVGASVREIVKKAHVTNSILYHYFKDKNELLYVIINRIGRELIETLRSVQKMHDDPVEVLANMIFAQVCVVEEKKKEVKIFLDEQYQLEPTYESRILQQHRWIYDLYREQLEALDKKGCLRDVNKTATNFAIHAMTNWPYRWYREGGPEDIEDVAKAITDMLFNGILIKSENFS